MKHRINAMYVVRNIRGKSIWQTINALILTRIHSVAKFAVNASVARSISPITFYGRWSSHRCVWNRSGENETPLYFCCFVVLFFVCEIQIKFRIVLILGIVCVCAIQSVGILAKHRIVAISVRKHLPARSIYWIMFDSIQTNRRIDVSIIFL